MNCMNNELFENLWAQKYSNNHQKYLKKRVHKLILYPLSLFTYMNIFLTSTPYFYYPPNPLFKIYFAIKFF